jgi:acyl carrier protein
MKDKEVFDRVKKIDVAQLGVASDRVTMATSFTKDLGADPIAVIELEFALGRNLASKSPTSMPRGSRPLVKR